MKRKGLYFEGVCQVLAKVIDIGVEKIIIYDIEILPHIFEKIFTRDSFVLYGQIVGLAHVEVNEKRHAGY